MVGGFRGRAGLTAKLMCGTAVALAAVLGAGAALAQTGQTSTPGGPVPPPSPSSAADQLATEAAHPAATPSLAPDTGQRATQDIVVTGTSLRGVAPVGGNLIAVSRNNIESTNAQTPQQILKTVPAVTGTGSSGQGSFGSADNSGTNAPTIHGLGASASNSTLVLINGHRIPTTGINHVLADPNVVPIVAIQRVEVLAEGASSIYGSDAVAGVINFITRKRYDGLELSGQASYGDKYHGYNANLLWGSSWDRGNFFLAYSYSDRSALRAGDRPFTHANHLSQGGSNLSSFACGPASIQPAGTSLIYAYPYTGTPVTNASANAFCDYSGLADTLPRDQRNSVYARLEQQLTDRITVSADINYSNRINRAQLQRGAVTATVFGPGSGRGDQINPFYTNPPGVTATSQTVRFDADELFPGGAKAQFGAENFFIDPEAVWRINDNFRLTVGGTFGKDDSRLTNLGQLCVSCANLALNGTTNATGSLTTPSIPGTSLIVLNTPLTTANALDVWNPLASNRTSPAVRARLLDNTNTQLAHQTLADWRGSLDGTLFRLPGGDVRAAVGAEFTRYTLRQEITRGNNTGPASQGSQYILLNYRRDVRSAYGELLIPIVGPENAIPLVRSFDFNVSGRYDDYSDFGSTKNPKFAANWVIVEGLKLRGNYARSFVAPALTSIGSGNGITGESGFAQYGLGPINVPVSAYPEVAQLPGCAGVTVCTLGTGITGIQLTGGNAGLVAQTGQTWSIGADYTPQWLRGFRASVTYWRNKFSGGVTAPTPSLAINAPDLHNLLTVYPGGATPAQVAAATGTLQQTGATPGNVFFIYDFRQRNVLNLDITGLDFDANYAFTTDFGRWTVGGAVSRFLDFNQRIGGGQVFSVLNTTGFNTTFPSIQTQARANLGWALAPFSADVFVNYIGSYRNWSSTTVAPITRNSAGYPTGGGDKVASTTTLDLHLAYTLRNFSMFRQIPEAQLYVDVNNLFDREPSFYNNVAGAGAPGASGFDPFGGNPIGRVISVGFRSKLF